MYKKKFDLIKQAHKPDRWSRISQKVGEMGGRRVKSNELLFSFLAGFPIGKNTYIFLLFQLMYVCPWKNKYAFKIGDFISTILVILFPPNAFLNFGNK